MLPRSDPLFPVKSRPWLTRRSNWVVGLAVGLVALGFVVKNIFFNPPVYTLVQHCDGGQHNKPKRGLTVRLEPFTGPGSDLLFTVGAFIAGDGHTLVLHYSLRGNDLSYIRLEEPRADIDFERLWLHTCFEVFVSRAGATAYSELNFSPSGAWQAQTFASYRSGAKASTHSFAASVAVLESTPQVFVLEARVDARTLLPRRGTTAVLGIASVLKHATQAASFAYYAARHVGREADFHLRESFCLELRAE